MKLQIRWTRGSDTGTAPARDASLGGLFVETDTPLEEGTLLSIEIVDGDDKVVMDARVISVRAKAEGESAPAGMGVRFLDLPDEAAGTLRRILARKMPREATVLGIGLPAAEPPPERGETIHGVGAVTREPTTPGIAPPKEILEEAKEKREAEKTLAEPAAVIKPVERESERKVEAAPPKPEARRVEVAPSRVEVAPAHDEEPAPASAKPAPRKPPPPPKPPPPRSSGSNFIRWLFVLLMAGAAFAAYVFRDEIAKLAAPEQTPTPSATPSVPPSAPPSATSIAENDVAVAPVVEDAAIAVAPDASVAREAGVKDAGVDAAHKDAGPHDAGHRDAAAHRPVEGGAPRP
ncbi:MAG TPA: PilZ domain-containing protein [Labilithrix sp.]|jgi:hypothetical protein